MRFIKNHTFAQKAQNAGFEVKPYEKSIFNAYGNECASVWGFAVNATKKELSQMGIMSSYCPLPTPEPNYWNDGEWSEEFNCWRPY